MAISEGCRRHDDMRDIVRGSGHSAPNTSSSPREFAQVTASERNMLPMNTLAHHDRGVRCITRAVRLALALLLLLAAPFALAHAQTQNTGTVAGNVTDAQGAVVAGATITLENVAEGNTLTATSNRKGEYIFSGVAVGVYTFQVSAPTFEKYVVPQVAVDANTNVREDGHMVAGSVDASVTVEANGTTIDTRSATLGTMIDSKLVEGLPIDGENIVSLAALLPGVTNVNAPSTFTSDTGGPTYSVSGSRGNQNLFLFDGIIWNNVFYNTGLNYPPRLGLQEVSVLLNNYKAQYGRNSGSIFNVLSRSGSNSIHGDVWEYYQSSAFDAADYLTQVNPHLVENQFGATIGGPIKRDKAFYFLSFQDLRLAGQSVAKDETFTYAERGFDAPGVAHPCSAASPSQFHGKTCADYTADFCYVTSSICLAPVTTATAIRNPIYTQGVTAISAQNAAWVQSGHTGTSPCVTDLTAYMNSQSTSSGQEHLPTPELPTECFNPVTVNFVNKYIPYATQFIGAAQQPEAVSSAKQPRNDNEGLARVDMNLGRHTVDARFFVTNVNDITSNSISQGQGVANYELDGNIGGIYSGNIGDTWTFSPNLQNIFRAGYKRYTYKIIPTDRTTISDLGANYTQPGHSFLPKMEATNRFTVGSPNSGDSYTVTANVEFNNDLSYVHGTHSFQVGAQFLDLDYVHRFDQVPSFQAEQQFTESSAADFMLGFQYNEVVGNTTNQAATQYNLYLYAQDDWRATSKLTLNYGLRYEIPFAWKESDGEGVTFKPGYQSVVFPLAPASVAYQGDPGIGNPAPPTKYSNLAPRVGFAYDVHGNGTLSIRGGFGLFYDTVNANVVGVSEPYHYTANYSQPAGGFSEPLLGLPCIPQNYVKGQSGASSSASGACLTSSNYFALPYTINYADPHMENPYVEAVNFGFQQRILRSATLEMNYVGKFGRHGIVPLDQNPSIYDCSGSFYQSNPTVYCPGSSIATTQASYEARSLYPEFNYGGQGIVDMESIGTSSYNGLQVIYSQRSSKSLNTYMSYTYGRSIDISSNGQTNTAHVPEPNHLRLEYAASDFNAQQILNLGWVLKLPSAVADHGFAGAVLDNWTFGGIYNARTGNPVNVTIAGDLSYTDERTQRPNLVPGQPLYVPGPRHRTDKVQEWFNVHAFQAPADGTFGNVRRNSLVGPAYINTNLVLQKLFNLPRSESTMEFRVDGFNVFNTPNLAQPNSSLSSSTSNQVASEFGEILSTVGTNGSVGTNGRRIQLGVILHY
jgi:hypothetical protein